MPNAMCTAFRTTTMSTGITGVRMTEVRLALTAGMARTARYSVFLKTMTNEAITHATSTAIKCARTDIVLQIAETASWVDTEQTVP